MKKNRSLTLNPIIEDIKKTLTFLKEIGYDKIECSENSLEITKKWNFNKLKSQIISCKKCRQSQNRKNIIIGEGSVNAELIFIGYAPGYEEEKSCRPIGGSAGILLDKIISAMGLSLESVYICNILKCPIENEMQVTENEIKACLPFLKSQIEKINPRFICTLGAKASRALLDSKAGMSALRGKFQNYGKVKVMPTFHPAELIKEENKKRYVWEDMKKIVTCMKRS